MTMPGLVETDVRDQFRVAEIAKNWHRVPCAPVEAISGYRWVEPPALRGQPLGLLFEAAIEYNRTQGYRLHSFQLHRMMSDPDTMNETIIAVFERINQESLEEMEARKRETGET